MLRDEASALGFNRLGVIPAGPARRLDAYLRWIGEGMQGEMGYMARPDRLARRHDPGLILPGVRSVVVVGLDYHTADLPPGVAADPSRGRISNYAWGVDYHEMMTPRLEALADWLRRQPGAGEVSSRVYVDTGAILERDHGETAGLGFTGKNTLLIDPRRGSWFFLGVLLTTQVLAYDPPPSERPPLPGCGRCTRCLSACPTAAFPAPYVLDARRCISYLTIELQGAIPEEFRPLIGNRIYGCDDCQLCCPWNRFARLGDPEFAPRHQLNEARLVDLFAWSEASFNERLAGSPIRRIGHVRWLRNIAVALGNAPASASVSEALASRADHPSALVREHVTWALASQAITSSGRAPRA